MNKTFITSIISAIGFLVSANAAVLLKVNDADLFTLSIVGETPIDSVFISGMSCGTGAKKVIGRFYGKKKETDLSTTHKLGNYCI